MFFFKFVLLPSLFALVAILVFLVVFLVVVFRVPLGVFGSLIVGEEGDSSVEFWV